MGPASGGTPCDRRGDGPLDAHGQEGAPKEALGRRNLSGERARLVLVGGGHSHLEVLRRQILRPHPGLFLTLVSSAAEQHYSGMVPGFLAGTYGEAEITFDLAALAERAGGRFLEATAASVDPARRLVRMADGRSLEYDFASFAVGSSAKGGELPGVREHAWPIKPIRNATKLRDALIGLASRPGAVRVVAVGAGAAGVEVACACAAILDRAGSPRNLAVADGGAEILEGYLPLMRRRARRVLEEKRVSIFLGVGVAQVRSDSVGLEDGRRIPSDLNIWLTGPGPPDLFRGSGLTLDSRGYLLVDDSLRSVSDPRVFGAGDCVTLASYPDTPKAGVYAVREGPVLWESLTAATAGAQPPRYRPQRRFLSILNTSDGKALLQYGGWVSRSRWSWFLKDRIDRRFMRRYRGLTS